MQASPQPVPRRIGRALCLAMSLVFAIGVSACGGEGQPAYDWRNRDLEWKYGPTTGTATPEHLHGTGTSGDGPMAEGWKCELRGGTKLTVQPFRLADEHAMFGKAGLVIGLFDQSSQRIAILRTPVITKDQASFSLDVDQAVARKVHDLILWYGKVE
ncbi:MAG: hypothetical protein KAI24_06230 [Planctomycetes bacterium]|nr:hypothetical protein [Planctomycetota bacterium]